MTNPALCVTARAKSKNRMPKFEVIKPTDPQPPQFAIVADTVVQSDVVIFVYGRYEGRGDLLGQLFMPPKVWEAFKVDVLKGNILIQEEKGPLRGLEPKWDASPS